MTVLAAPPGAPPPSLEVSEANGSRAPSSSWTAASSRRGVYSSLGYREQAANLMAQIRSDMKGSKRIFSGDTEASRLVADEPSRREKLEALPLGLSTRRGSMQVRGPEAHGALGTTRGKKLCIVAAGGHISMVISIVHVSHSLSLLLLTVGQ